MLLSEEFYGVDGKRVSFRNETMSARLLTWLLEEEIMSAAPSRLLQLGFSACCDYPGLPNHHYYEGYFHARGDAAFDVPAQNSLHPRTGRTFEKPAAPPRLAAFVEAFRRANRDWLCDALATAADAAAGGAAAGGAAAGGAAALFEDLFRRGAHFADLAVQVHYGDGVPDEQLGWHVDNANSALHLALSLRGRRWLHTERRQGAAAAAAEDRERVATELVAGSVYLSSPAAVLHAPQYPTCGWEDRVVAVQCRFLLSGAEAHALASEPAALRRALERLTPVLAAAPLCCPTLEEAQAVASERGGGGERRVPFEAQFSSQVRAPAPPSARSAVAEPDLAFAYAEGFFARYTAATDGAAAWEEVKCGQAAACFSFVQHAAASTAEALVLHDETRRMFVRIPAAGGASAWSADGEAWNDFAHMDRLGVAFTMNGGTDEIRQSFRAGKVVWRERQGGVPFADFEQEPEVDGCYRMVDGARGLALRIPMDGGWACFKNLRDADHESSWHQLWEAMRVADGGA